ncbi:MAG: hypothetical protein HKN31_10585 [Pricia sp.]|nr:hypothetical protein [Pricia sp.]
MFRTSGTTQAIYPDIATYNNFVQGFADAENLGLGWTAIASTSAVNARDNTATATSDGVGVPIFDMAGTLIAVDYIDLWDGSILNNLRICEDGTQCLPSHNGIGPTAIVWTGTNADGTTSTNRPFGPNLELQTTVGAFFGTGGDWINDLRQRNSSQDGQLYALSPLFTAPVPIPAAGWLFMTALLGLVGKKRLSV